MWKHLRFRKPKNVLFIQLLVYVIISEWKRLNTNPDNVFFCEPSKIRLHAGIFDSLTKPPAAPRTFAAVAAPTIIEIFGAINVIRLSTYSKIIALYPFRSTAISQASSICILSISVNIVLFNNNNKTGRII